MGHKRPSILIGYRVGGIGHLRLTLHTELWLLPTLLTPSPPVK